MGVNVHLLVWIIVGALAGWIAGKIVRGAGFGFLGNVVVGIVGSVIAGWLLPQLGVSLGTGFLRSVIDAAIGAIVLLVLIGLIRRA